MGVFLSRKEVSEAEKMDSLLYAARPTVNTCIYGANTQGSSGTSVILVYQVARQGGVQVPLPELLDISVIYAFFSWFALPAFWSTHTSYRRPRRRRSQAAPFPQSSHAAFAGRRRNGCTQIRSSEPMITIDTSETKVIKIDLPVIAFPSLHASKTQLGWVSAP